MRLSRLRASGPGQVGVAGVALAVALSLLGWTGSPGAAAARAQTARHVTLEGNGLGAVHLGTSEAAVVRKLAAQLGSPSSSSPAGCVGYDPNVAWHDLIVQFKGGRFAGYRYWAPAPNQRVTPRLATVKGITLGSTFGELKRVYRLTQTGTDFWSGGGMTFGLAGAAYPSPPSAPVYEVKVAACPAAL